MCEQVHELDNRVPEPFLMPSLGSWLTVTKIANPNTKPSITGRDRNCAKKPSRKSPATRNRPPHNSTAAAEDAAATKWRLVPNTAYAASVTSSVYSPALGESPASPA